jgi:NAD(P)-dependent dehydrogenase (short-subunit alcohol dehydrogenase family)
VFSKTLEGRQIIVAGGSGGLGAETSRLLAQEGAGLVIGYWRNAERARQLADVGAIVQADITTQEGRQALLDAAPQAYGLVVFSGQAARAQEESQVEPVLRRSWEHNFLGPILLARAAAAGMRARSDGAIVLISTMQAVAVFPNSTAYAAPKAALVHAGRILAKELRGFNVRVNVICPGAHNAGIARETIAAGKYDRYLQEGAVTRWGRPLDVARAVRFFLEPDNYITGQVLTVDGGLSL